MVVRANYPRNEFDPNGDYSADQAWRLADLRLDRPERRRQPLDGCRRRRCRRPHRALEELEDRRRSRPELRRVRDGQGRVRPLHVPPGRLEHASVVRPRPGEHARRTASSSACSTAKGRSRFRSRDFKVRIDFYDNVDWPWVTTTPVAGGAFTATMNVPADAPYGMYDGAVVLNGSGETMVVPVSVTRRRDGHAGRGRQAHRPAPLRWRGHGGEPVRPALQQRLLLRSQRLDVAGGVRRLALLLRRRPRRAG